MPYNIEILLKGCLCTVTMSTVKYSWQYRTLYLKVIDLNRKPNLITRIWSHLPVYQAQTHNQMTNHHSFFFKAYCLYLLINYTSILNTSLPPPSLYVWCFLFNFIFLLLLLFFCHCLSFFVCALICHTITTWTFYFPPPPFPIVFFLDFPYLVPYMIHTFHHLKLWFKWYFCVTSFRHLELFVNSFIFD